VVELNDMIFSAHDGPVKNELLKVLKNANKHVQELKDHIKEGKDLVKTKETSLTQVQKKLNHKLDPPHVLAEPKKIEEHKHESIAQVKSKDEKDIEKRADAAVGVKIDYVETRSPPHIPVKEESKKNATAPVAPAPTNASKPAEKKNETKPAKPEEKKAEAAPVKKADEAKKTEKKAEAPAKKEEKKAEAPAKSEVKKADPAPAKAEVKTPAKEAEKPAESNAAVQVEESKKVKVPVEDEDDEEAKAAKILNSPPQSTA
jgi:hypothetical protein